jgi:hypothetical protein
MDANLETSYKPEPVKEFFKSRPFWKAVLSIILGGVGGFLIYHFVGCKTNACAAAGNPYVTIITGSILGFLMTCSACFKLK